MEMKLQDARKKVPRIRNVSGDMEFGAWIKVTLGPRLRLAQSLVVVFQVPPCCIVVLGRNRAREHAPAPPVERERKRQKRDLVERDTKQHCRVTGGTRQTVEQTDLLEVRGRDRERDRVTDRLVKAVV